MHSYFFYNFLMFFYMYSVMVLISAPVGPCPVYDSDVVYFHNYLFHFVFKTKTFIQEVVEPEIPTDPIVEFFVKENNDLKAKLKRSEDLRLQCLEEKMKLEFKLADIIDEHEFKLADVVNAHEIKMDAMRLKTKKIRKYAISQEAWYHYAVGSMWLSLTS